jgi:polyisoprenoid-binding protein YceI
MYELRKRIASVAGVAVVAASLLLPVPAAAEPLQLTLDQAHTSVTFKVRHLFTNVTGQFRDFEGSIAFDEANPAASAVNATIQTASIDTNNERRDTHLRSGDFFLAEEHPTIEFASTGVQGSGTSGKVSGTLTIRGVTKHVVLETEFLGSGKDPWGNTRYGFHAETTINRKDFGMEWNQALEAGGVMVGDEVQIILDIEAVPAE